MSLVVVVIGLVLASQAYRYRIRIETWVWHVRHGTVLTVGNYVLPVPANWDVENEGNDIFMMIRLDTDDRTPLKKLKWNASILLLPQRPMKDEGLNRLLSVELDFLKKRGVDPVPQRTLTMADETIFCIGGGMPSPPETPDIFDVQPVTWSCKSAGGLDLKMSGIESDLKQGWEIVTNIRKKS